MSRIFFALVKKEYRVILKDWHSLAALFILPVIFILFMSYALKDASNSSSNLNCSYFIDTNNSQDLATKFEKKMESINGFSCKRSLVKEHSKNADFFAIFPANFFDNFKNDKNLTSSIELLYDPSLNTAVIMLLESVLKEKVVMLYGINDNAKFTPIFLTNMQKEFIKKSPFGKNIPNSVEQSVPSWLVFAMFFVLIPLSTVFMVEKDQGTFKRLQSLKISPLLFFGAKTLTYNIINILQGILMLLVGVYLVPVFGLEALRISSPFAIFILMYSLSLAAIGFALLIATLSKTSGQAIIIGGLSNVLLGSIGGIMIPKYVMPDGAQMLSNISPMSWGLDGFLELFLNQGTISDIWQYVAFLSLFGFVLFCVSLFIFNRQKGD